MKKIFKNKKILLFVIFVLIVIPISTAMATIVLEMQIEWPAAPGGAYYD